MKILTKHPAILAFTTDDGVPVCGDCIIKHGRYCKFDIDDGPRKGKPGSCVLSG